jgi:hypothetical protein
VEQNITGIHGVNVIVCLHIHILVHSHLFSFHRSNHFPVGMDMKHVTYYKFMMTTHHSSIDPKWYNTGLSQIAQVVK